MNLLLLWEADTIDCIQAYVRNNSLNSVKKSLLRSECFMQTYIIIIFLLKLRRALSQISRFELEMLSCV